MAYLTRRSLRDSPPQSPITTKYADPGSSSNSSPSSDEVGDGDGAWSTKTDNLIVCQNWIGTGGKRTRSQGRGGGQDRGKGKRIPKSGTRAGAGAGAGAGGGSKVKVENGEGKGVIKRERITTPGPKPGPKSKAVLDQKEDDDDVDPPSTGRKRDRTRAQSFASLASSSDESDNGGEGTKEESPDPIDSFHQPSTNTDTSTYSESLQRSSSNLAVDDLKADPKKSGTNDDKACRRSLPRRSAGIPSRYRDTTTVVSFPASTSKPRSIREDDGADEGQCQKPPKKVRFDESLNEIRIITDSSDSSVSKARQGGSRGLSNAIKALRFQPEHHTWIRSSDREDVKSSGGGDTDLPVSSDSDDDSNSDPDPDADRDGKCDHAAQKVSSGEDGQLVGSGGMMFTSPGGEEGRRLDSLIESLKHFQNENTETRPHIVNPASSGPLPFSSPPAQPPAPVPPLPSNRLLGPPTSEPTSYTTEERYRNRSFQTSPPGEISWYFTQWQTPSFKFDKFINDHPQYNMALVEIIKLASPARWLDFVNICASQTPIGLATPDNDVPSSCPPAPELGSGLVMTSDQGPAEATPTSFERLGIPMGPLRPAIIERNGDLEITTYLPPTPPSRPRSQFRPRAEIEQHLTALSRLNKPPYLLRPDLLPRPGWNYDLARRTLQHSGPPQTGYRPSFRGLQDETQTRFLL